MFKVLFFSLILVSPGVTMNNIQYFEDDLPPTNPKPKPPVPG